VENGFDIADCLLLCLVSRKKTQGRKTKTVGAPNGCCCQVGVTVRQNRAICAKVAKVKEVRARAEYIIIPCVYELILFAL